MGIDVVTGATGHLGNVLVRELLSRGRRVKAVVQPGDDGAALAELGVEQVPADVRDAGAMRAAFAQAERVFHLAGIVCVTRSHRRSMRDVNVNGTRAVMAACRAAGVARLVHMGSVHALTETRSPVLDETAGFDPAKATGLYGKSKAEACVEVQRAVKDGRLDAVIALPTGVVGPYDTRLSEVGQVLLDLEAGRVPFLIAGGHDWVDVRDVAVGTLSAAERGVAGEAYLLGSERLTLRDIARVVHEETGARVPAAIPGRLATVLSWPVVAWEALSGQRALLTPFAVHALTVPFTVSHEKATRVLGFAPRPVRQALRDALAWLHAHEAQRVQVGAGRQRTGRAVISARG
jgi:dihydroflavonol-4-reductase